MNTIEEKIWSYIDGTCSEEEQKAISKLIAQDEGYRRVYEELLSLDQQFSKMEPEEPSMAFTYKVMESIRAEHAQEPLKSSINPGIIKGITGFFILSILTLIVYVLSNLHLSTASFSGSLPVSLKLPDMKNIFSSSVINGFLFFDVVLALFLFDAYLRKRKISKTGTN